MKQQTSVPFSSVTASSDFVDFTLKQLRVAFIRSRCLSNEIEIAGVELRAGLVSAEAALAHVIEAGGEAFLNWASS
jgi:hypothetical protein